MGGLKMNRAYMLAIDSEITFRTPALDNHHREASYSLGEMATTPTFTDENTFSKRNHERLAWTPKDTMSIDASLNPSSYNLLCSAKIEW